jgi:hypothetical protein
VADVDDGLAVFNRVLTFAISSEIYHVIISKLMKTVLNSHHFKKVNHQGISARCRGLHSLVNDVL